MCVFGGVGVEDRAVLVDAAAEDFCRLRKRHRRWNWRSKGWGRVRSSCPQRELKF